MGKLRDCLLWVVLVAGLLLIDTLALKWSATPEDGAVIYSCSGDDLTLGWDYTLDSGEHVTSIGWKTSKTQGATEEDVAVAFNGQFTTCSKYGSRVTFLPCAGILLSNVAPEDSGSYSVNVHGNDFNDKRMVHVHVAGSLMTEDGELHAHVEPVPVQDSSTGEFAICLACGHFTYVGHPPIDVEWTTPEGKTLPSTRYHKDFFELHLPGPVIGGVYTCSISSSSLNASCLHDAKATVHLNDTRARLTLLEAEDSHKDKMISQMNNSTCLSGHHEVRDEPWRLTSNGRSSKCDKDILPHKEKWYRFQVNGKDVKMPTSAPPTLQCGTDGPVWMNLNGDSLPGQFQQKQVLACGRWESNTCYRETWIWVGNCGAFWVYKIAPIIDCSFAFCMEYA